MVPRVFKGWNTANAGNSWAGRIDPLTHELTLDNGGGNPRMASLEYFFVRDRATRLTFDVDAATSVFRVVQFLRLDHYENLRN